MSRLDEATPRDHALLFAEILFQAGTPVEELRALRVPMRYGKAATVSGYFDNPNDFAAAAMELSEKRKAPAVYCTLNRLDPRLLGRACNRLQDHPQATTADGDVLSPLWIPLDLDPARPTGVSATDEEHEAALDLALSIKAALLGEGHPAPVLADSGNGAHLLYPAPPNATPEAVKAVLEALARRFSTTTVKVDTAVFNAARIWKVPGTWCRKGDNTPAQPHRRSRLLEVPEYLCRTVQP